MDEHRKQTTLNWKILEHSIPTKQKFFLCCLFVSNLCNPLDNGPLGVKSKVLGIIKKTHLQGFSSKSNSDIFMSGHSLGSSCAQMEKKEKKKKRHFLFKT